MPEFDEHDQIDDHIGGQLDDQLDGQLDDQLGEQLGGLFAGVDDVVTAHMRPMGVEVIYATVRRRRRNRMVAGAALVVLLVLGPAAGLALAKGQDRDVPPPADRRTPTSTTDATTPPAATPTAAPSSASPDPTGPVDHGGRLSLADLAGRTLDLPPWPKDSGCAQDRVELTEPPDSADVIPTFVGDPVHVDIDGDRGDETAVLIECAPQWADYKVVVFDRDADDRIVTVGPVISTSATADTEIKKVWAIDEAPDGDIRVDVGDYAPCCSIAADLPQHQWRTFGWTGRRFTQTGGPTGFGPNPKVTDLVTTATAPTMTGRADGTYAGTIKVTVRNAGPFSATVDLTLSGGAGLSAKVTGRAGCRYAPFDDSSHRCGLGRLAAGDRVTLEVQVTAAADLSREVRFHAGHVKGELSYPDLTESNNDAKIRVRAT